MGSERGFLSSFEEATGIDVPESICGVEVPDPDLGDLGELAGNILNGLGDMSEMLDKAVAVRELVATGAQKAGNCWGVIDRGADVISAIRDRIEPLEPLFHPLDNAAAAMAMFNKENLDAVVAVILDVLDLGKLLEKIMDILDGVKDIFCHIGDTCGDVFDSIRDFMGDMVEELLSALHLDGALDSLGDLFEGVKSLICELVDIGDVLKPILEAWQEANFMEAATYGMQKFDDVKDALDRFMPSWETCQRHYETASSYGFNGFEAAQKAFKLVRMVVSKLSQLAGVAIPGGFGARAIDMQPTVAPRGGIAPIEESEEDQEAHMGGQNMGDEDIGPEDAPDRLRSLFRRFKDSHRGISVDRMRELIETLGGLEPDEIDEMIRNADRNQNGIIEPDEFVDWLWGDSVCDEDRDALMGVD